MHDYKTFTEHQISCCSLVSHRKWRGFNLGNMLHGQHSVIILKTNKPSLVLRYTLSHRRESCLSLSTLLQNFELCALFWSLCLNFTFSIHEGSIENYHFGIHVGVYDMLGHIFKQIETSCIHLTSIPRSLIFRMYTIHPYVFGKTEVMN